MHLMSRYKKILLSVLFCVTAAACLFAVWLCAGTIPGAVNAESSAAKELTADCEIRYEGESVTVSCGEKIAGLYIEWKKVPGEWSLRAEEENGGETEMHFGLQGYLHEFAAVSGNTVVLNVAGFREKVKTFRVFGEGTLPADVQVWDPPCEEADLMLLSTHADDEHLFFAGILPYYAGELQKDVQVVYMVNHNNTESRPHELLDGLWAVGVRHYPVIGAAPDLYSESLSDAYASFSDAGYQKEYFVQYVTEAIRRFRPLVVVGHDINGEYGHGAHMLYTDTLREASVRSGDAAYDAATAEKYGTWTVPKIYIHLYEENQIVMDWDNKFLTAFGGRSAFQVSIEEGFSRHASQHYTWFSKWSGYDSAWNVKSAADIEQLAGKPGVPGTVRKGGLSPRLFGLYASTVGEDKEKNDFFENIDRADFREPEETLAPEVTETPENPPQTEMPPAETQLPQVTEPAENTAAQAPAGDRDGDAAQGGDTDKIIFIVLLALFAAVACIMILRYLKKK